MKKNLANLPYPSISSGQALRQQAEAKLRENKAQTPAALSPEETRQMLHELQVHQIELEMQNEELRRGRLELEQAQARYFELYDLAPIGYLVLSERGLILEANLTAASLLGVARGALVGQPLSYFILPQDQDIHYLHSKRLFETGEPQAYALKLQRKETPFWAHLTTTAARVEDDAPVWGVVISDITERKQAEEGLNASLVEKEVLLKEIHHRVKNNLQVISSLLEAESDAVADVNMLAALQHTQERIRAIAGIHEQLYQSPDLAQVDMAAYIENLVGDLQRTYNARGANIRIEAANARMGIDQAIPCGLLINELVSNAFKHAFPEDWEQSARGERKIWVSMTFNDGNWALSVGDNGVSLPESFDMANSAPFGLRLVRMLTRQLRGTLSTDDAGGQGKCFTITFASSGR